MNSTAVRFVHFDVRVIVNEDSSWYHTRPGTERELHFALPVEMFDATNFTKMIRARVEEALAEFPAVKAEYEAEEAAKEAERKVAEETNA